MRLDYLKSGSKDCPLIRLWSTTIKEFAQLRHAIEEFRLGKPKILHLHELPFIAPFNHLSLTLKIANKDGGIYETKPGVSAFEWILPEHRWTMVESLIEPFEQLTLNNRHQWLCGKEASGMLASSEIAVLITDNKEGKW